MEKGPGHVAPSRRGQAGITAMSTAIVLIAFVVVSSVFSFAGLSSGLFAADRTKETFSSALSESGGTMNITSSVTAKALTGGSLGAAIDEIIFQVSNAAGGEPINLTPGQTVIRYTDANQMVIFDSQDEFTVVPLGNADDDNLVEQGELYEITIPNLVAVLTADLTTSDTFVVEVIPASGPVPTFSRTLPSFLTTFNNLR